MTSKFKSTLLHWIVEMVAGLIVIGVGVGLIVFIPDNKQATVDTAAYKGSAAYGIVILGVLAILNSVRRALFRKKT